MANKIARQVLKTMTDEVYVLHDQVSPKDDFVRDYATGKGVLFDHFGFLADGQPLTSEFPQFMLNNAAAVWNSRSQSDPIDQLQFNWNVDSERPPSFGVEWQDNFPNELSDCLVLQVAGLSALVQGMRIAPDEQIPDQLPPKPASLT